MCSSKIFSIQCRLDIGLYDSFENLSFPCLSMGRILDVLRISGNLPAFNDLLIANAIKGAQAFGVIFKNFILVSLNPRADEFLDFLIMSWACFVVICGIIIRFPGFMIRFFRKMSGS